MRVLLCESLLDLINLNFLRQFDELSSMDLYNRGDHLDLILIDLDFRAW